MQSKNTEHLIDAADRTKVADAIENYLNGDIDNFMLDDILWAAKDRAAFEIACEVWFFYTDTKRHKNEDKYRINEAGETILRRWILLLRTDHEWPANEIDSRKRWYSPDRWTGLWKPIGCLLGLLILPVALFEVLILSKPHPRHVKNEYWPFHTAEDWDCFQ